MRGGDDEDVADAGDHQRRQRIVDHRLVVHGQQLLGRAHGDRIQPRARSAGQDDATHQPARSLSVSSVAANAVARSGCRNTDVMWSRTTRNAAAAMVLPADDVTFSSTTTTPSCKYNRPGSALKSEDCAHSSSAVCPWVAPLASPTSISSLDSDSRVSKSRSLSASCQARTVAISEVVMVVKLRHLERRVLQPAVPDGSIAEYLDPTVRGGPAPHDGQQQLLGRAAQRDVSLAVVVGPRHSVHAVARDGPLPG